ncbi:MAG: histone deacetylase [Planctomycetota bacterium]
MLHTFYSDGVDIPLPPKHPFPHSKYRLLRERVERLAERLPLVLAPAREATEEELLRVHTAGYVAEVLEGRLSEEHQRAIGFPWSPDFVRRSRRSTGATVMAAHAVMGDGSGNGQRAWGAHLAGGTHHASADRGQGFCVFNDVAVAIRSLQATGLTRRAVVLDCDVHQGNGTALLFGDDPDVFTFSIHGAKNFPLRKEQSDLDVPLEDGTGDAEYLAKLAPALKRVWNEEPFDVAFYISGADPFAQDRYGRMGLSREGLRERDELVLSQCRERGLPTVTVMGGGYARDVEAVADIYAATIEVAAQYAAKAE